METNTASTENFKCLFHAIIWAKKIYSVKNMFFFYICNICNYFFGLCRLIEIRSQNFQT